MATYAPSSATANLPYSNGPYKPAAAAPSQPSGTFLPGTKVTVGNHRVMVEKYLSEGGFAHVYVVRLPRDNNKHELAVLKRVAVPDRTHLANMRTEVETMKKLKGHRHIVTYIDSHASQLKGGGYEVFLLMEYCNGGGLIDFMNTRLQHRLTEPEILKIFGDIAEGVATMHYLKPPLLHRDLKVENVLISKSSSGTPNYKVCDFGSSAAPIPAATTADEARLIEDDVQQHTTMQYRSPEMIDVWRKQPINEKADIWALGVLLYKLCYYTTPFEEVGQMAILNASFKYPSSPSFSDGLKRLIGWMLKEDPRNRPNIYQVVKEVCGMRGTEVPIKDIYTTRTQSEARQNERLPPRESDITSPPPKIGLSKVAPPVETQKIPDVKPERRGRPPAPASNPATVAPSPRISGQVGPTKGDPFAALDSKSFDVRSKAVDELSKKYPSLDEFSITHEKDGKFQFPSDTPGAMGGKKESLNERVTKALADEVFKIQPAERPQTGSLSTQTKSQSQQRNQSPPRQASSSRLRAETSREPPLVQQPTPVKPGVMYMSTGTNPSPPPQKPSPLPPQHSKYPDYSKRPIWHVPAAHQRSESQPRASDAAMADVRNLQPGLAPSRSPALLEINRSKSQTSTEMSQSRSSRPSLEGNRPSHLEVEELALARSTSAQTKPRPTSAYLSSNIDFLKQTEMDGKRKQVESKRVSTDVKRPSADLRRLSRERSQDAENAIEIGSDLTYLRSHEDESGMKRKPSGRNVHKKNRSISNSLSGAKNMFAGRFGDAFKRFEHGGSHSSSAPETDDDKELDTQLMAGPKTPEYRNQDAIIEAKSPSSADSVDGTFSYAPGKNAAYEHAEEEEMPPEMRRELERRQLEQEEKRVAEAAKQYRSQVSGKVQMAGARAKTIQNRVQSLLDEGRQSPEPRKTATGYGRHTEDTPSGPDAPLSQHTRPPRTSSLANTPLNTEAPLISQRTRPQTSQISQTAMPVPSASAPPAPASHQIPQPSGRRDMSRPSAPPKPKTLRTGGQWPPTQPSQSIESPSSNLRSTGLQALLQKDLEGVPDYPTPSSSATNAAARSPPAFSGGVGSISDTVVDTTDIEADFSKRYPSLAGIEMIETEIEDRKPRVREV